MKRIAYKIRRTPDAYNQTTLRKPMKKDKSNSCKRPPTEAESRLTKAKLDVDTERYGNMSPVEMKLLAENIKLKKELEALKKKVKSRSAFDILVELVEDYKIKQDDDYYTDRDGFRIEYNSESPEYSSVTMEYPDGEEYSVTVQKSKSKD